MSFFLRTPFWGETKRKTKLHFGVSTKTRHPDGPGIFPFFLPLGRMSFSFSRHAQRVSVGFGGRKFSPRPSDGPTDRSCEDHLVGFATVRGNKAGGLSWSVWGLECGGFGGAGKMSAVGSNQRTPLSPFIFLLLSFSFSFSFSPSLSFSFSFSLFSCWGKIWVRGEYFCGLAQNGQRSVSFGVPSQDNPKGVCYCETPPPHTKRRVGLQRQ